MENLAAISEPQFTPNEPNCEITAEIFILVHNKWMSNKKKIKCKMLSPSTGCISRVP